MEPMMKTMRWTLALVLAMAACSKAPVTMSSAPPPPPTMDTGPRYTWWQDVQPIVAAKCQLCHSSPPQYGSPMSLVTFADTRRIATTGAAIYQAMATRVTATRAPMPPPSNVPLTTQEKDIIVRWAAIGGPEGEPPSDAGVIADDGAQTPDAMSPAPDAAVGNDASVSSLDGATGVDATSVDGSVTSTQVEIRMHGPGGGPYTLPTGHTNYVCVAASPNPTSGSVLHATRFEPILDNTRNIHHMLLFKNAARDKSAGPFSCDGFPLGWELIAGWAPGRMADDMPAGVGVLIQPGEQIILQAHYDNVTQAGTMDQSGFRLTMTDATGLLDAGMLWSGYIFLAPLNGSMASRSGSCRLNSSFTMFSDFPHMHQLGSRITLDVKRAGQSTWTTLAVVDPWGFQDQPNVAIDPGQQQFSPGDTLRTTCVWDTQGQSVSFGEASSDEMCFNFVYHYPVLADQHACITTGP
jgi:hypothetical protein